MHHGRKYARVNPPALCGRNYLLDAIRPLRCFIDCTFVFNNAILNVTAGGPSDRAQTDFSLLQITWHRDEVIAGSVFHFSWRVQAFEHNESVEGTVQVTAPFGDGIGAFYSFPPGTIGF